MSGISGDFSKMAVLLQRVSAERIDVIKRALIVNLAEEALKQIKLGFEQGRAPNDAQWKPLKSKRGRDAKDTKGIPLNDSGRLKNSWTPIVSSDGFSWHNETAYAAAHNYGVSNRTRRFGSKPAARKSLNRSSLVRSVQKLYMASREALPARPMIPAGGVLPSRWKSAFESVIQRTLARYGAGG